MSIEEVKPLSLWVSGKFNNLVYLSVYHINLVREEELIRLLVVADINMEEITNVYFIDYTEKPGLQIEAATEKFIEPLREELMETINGYEFT